MNETKYFALNSFQLASFSVRLQSSFFISRRKWVKSTKCKVVFRKQLLKDKNNSLTEIKLNLFVSCNFTTVVAWPSGLRRWFKAPVSSEAWVRIPPLPDSIFSWRRETRVGRKFARSLKEKS